MSAILALFERHGPSPDQARLLQTMLSAAPERAVDGQDVWMRDEVALAHQHFWLTPEEQGERQPLLSADGQCAVTCDGRLDNRSELAAALDIAAQAQTTVSDAFLILAAYEKWGTRCVDRLLGDFCFAIWDVSRHHLFVACDALGARTPSYYVDEDRCIVASEILSILAHPAVRPILNEVKVAAYLTGELNESDESFYQGIFYCPPAHCLRVTAESVEIWRYWDVDPEQQICHRTDGEFAEHYLSLLKEAVRCHLRSTGPIAVSMSGGLDSTAITALGARLLSEAQVPCGRLKIFSYAFDELKGCDERAYIRPVAGLYDLDVTYIPCDDEWTLCDLATWPVERDYVWSNAYARLPKAVMASAQAKGCRLLLGGYYGDTLFGGGAFWALDLLRQFRWGELVRIAAKSPLGIDWRSDVLDRGLRQLVPRRIRHTVRRLRPRRAEASHPGLHPDFVRRTRLAERMREEEHWRSFRIPGYGARYRSLALRDFPQGRAAVRRPYNRHRLELETPYYDRRLVEFVLSVPADQLARPGWDRWVHRKAMSGLLPEPVRLRREKTVFVPLLEKGLLREERDAVSAILRDPEIVRRRIIRREWLETALGSRDPASTEWQLLWLCISLELWLSRFWGGATGELDLQRPA